MAQVAVRAPAAAVSAVLPPEFAAVQVARELVHTALDDWGAEPLADDVALVVSELVANALLYGLCLPPDSGSDQGGPADIVAGRAGQIEFQMVSTGSHLICTVRDPSPAPPIRREPDNAEPGGRGLLLIEALSMCWGWTPSGGAKAVWAIFPMDTGGAARVTQVQARHAPVRRAS